MTGDPRQPDPGAAKDADEVKEAAEQGEEQVKDIPPAPGAPMQHGENR